MKKLLPVLTGFVFLLLSSTEGWSLPVCPDSPTSRWSTTRNWTDCFGTIIFSDGSKYVGEWKNRKWHGQGTLYYAHGGVEQEGIFENNKFLYAQKLSPTFTAKHAPTKRSSLPFCPGSPTSSWGTYSNWTDCFGTYTFADGNKYVGEFMDGSFNGQGTYTYADGRVKEGIWEYSTFLYAKKPSPIVTAKHAPTKRSSLPFCPGSPTSSWGTYSNWTDCFGTYTFADGNKYVGEFMDGSFNGQGTYTYADGRVKEGIWEYSTFLYAKKPSPTLTAQQIAEAKRREEVQLAKRAKARAEAKREKALYDALVATANADLADLQDFITANPGTPGLIDIVTDVAAVKAALTERKGSSLKTALADLRATLSKKKGFSAFMVSREKERKIRLAAERRRAEEKRKQEMAAAKRQKKERARRQAAQVKVLKEDLKSYAGFLKRQVVKNMVSNSGMAQALVPLVKRLEIGLSSNDLSVLKALKGWATDALRKHGLSGQYAEVRKLMAAARKAKREKAAAAEREKKAAVFAAKERKKEEARLVAEKKAAAVLAARQAKERKALQKQDKALAARQEKYRYDIAVIIGNRKYTGGTPEVEFAHNDADQMKRFVIDQVGYRTGNIIDLRDTTKAQLEAVFGNNNSYKGRLNNWVRAHKSNVIVFYSGHGVPGLKDRRGYLLPVDADPNLVELNGYPVDTLYRNLNQIPAKSITVYLDACFSGDSPRGMIIRATSGISVEAIIPEKAGKLTILTAARGNQFASWDEKAKLGLFTRHLLDALKGAADGKGYGNGDRKVTVSEVERYLSDEMTYQARRRYNRDQNATVQGDPNRVLSVF